MSKLVPLFPLIWSRFSERSLLVTQPKIKFTCPIFDETTNEPWQSEIRVQIHSLDTVILEELSKDKTSNLTNLPTDEELKQLMPVWVNVGIGSCMVPTQKFIDPADNGLKYQFLIKDFQKSCSTLESNIKIGEEEAYSLKNVVNFNIPLAQNRILPDKSVVVEERNYNFKFQSQIECLYSIDYTVSLDFEANINRYEERYQLEAAASKNAFSVDMNIFENEKFENFIEKNDNETAPFLKFGNLLHISASLANAEMYPPGFNLHAFHCWGTADADICSKPHYSIIEESCPDPFVEEYSKDENGIPSFVLHSPNGAGGEFFNFTVPVFKIVKPDTQQGAGLTHQVWLTCDFEVCAGTCEPTCPVPEIDEEEAEVEVNYLCEGGRKKRSSDRVVSQIGPFIRLTHYRSLFTNEELAANVDHFYVIEDKSEVVVDLFDDDEETQVKKIRLPVPIGKFFYMFY